MTTAAIIIAVIILFALLRFGVAAEYSADGFTLTAHAGPLIIRLLPGRERPGAAERKARRKARKMKKSAASKKKKEKRKVEMPGGLKAYLDMLPPIKNALGRIRRKLLIKKLTIHYTAAGGDSAATAMMFGAANAVFGTTAPLLENNFRVKRRDLRVCADFQTQEQKIYLHAAVSIAVWESVYIVLALFPILMSLMKRKPVNIDRKEETQNGQAPDK